MELKQLKAAVEAVLFASGDPITEERLAETVEADKPTVAKIVSQLIDEYSDEARGIAVVRLAGAVQMTTKQTQAAYVKKALEITRDMPLSSAAMEVLSIVAYNQPVTRSFIEQVRGIDSSGVMGSLSIKGLIEECGRLDLPGRPIAYRTTDGFLRCFGMESLSELPPLPKNELEMETPDRFEEETEE